MVVFSNIAVSFTLSSTLCEISRSTVALIGMEVYNSPLKFERDYIRA